MPTNSDFERAKQRLSQLSYPISKGELIQGAQKEGADAQSISILERLPEQSFATLQDVLDALKTASS
jgi:hypothetical protein